MSLPSTATTATATAVRSHGDAPLLQITRLLATYDLLAVPVLDAERRLVGVVSVDDVLDHLLPEDWRETNDESAEGIVHLGSSGASRG